MIVVKTMIVVTMAMMTLIAMTGDDEKETCESNTFGSGVCEHSGNDNNATPTLER